jgi:hypothetical protein
MKHLSFFSLVTVTLGITLLSACKKKEDKPVTAEPNPSSASTCFNSQYNGLYIGSGILTSGPFTYGTLSLSKTNCQEVSLNLSVNTGAGISTQATQLHINAANNDYEGKLSNGNNVTISLGGKNIYINAVGSFTFNGNKN